MLPGLISGTLWLKKRCDVMVYKNTESIAFYRRVIWGTEKQNDLLAWDKTMTQVPSRNRTWALDLRLFNFTPRNYPFPCAFFSNVQYTLTLSERVYFFLIFFLFCMYFTAELLRKDCSSRFYQPSLVLELLVSYVCCDMWEVSPIFLLL